MVCIEFFFEKIAKIGLTKEIWLLYSSIMYTRIYRTKNKDGSVREYLQIVETRRVPEKSYPVQRLLLNVARIDHLGEKGKEQLFNLARGILKVLGKEIGDIEEITDVKKTGDKFWWGFLAILSGVWKLLKLDSIIKGLSDGKKIQFPIEKVIFAIVAGRLYGKVSERGIYHWLEKVYKGFGLDKIEMQWLYRGLDILAERWDEVEGRLKGRVLDLFHQEANILFIDTTSLVYWGKGDGRFTKRGYSKQRRGDKNQVVIGVALVNGLPIGIEIEPGNTSDVEVMRKMIGRFKERFNFKKVCIVADAGMVKIKDTESYRERDWKYLVRAKASEKVVKEKVKEARETADWEKVDDGLWAKRFEVKFSDGKKEWLIVVKDEAEERYDRESRASIIKRLREKEGKDMKELLSNKGYKKYVATGSEIKINEEKMKESEIWDGIWVIRTNEEFEDIKVAIERYKDLWMVEKVFKDLKNILSISPIGHWKESRIKGHIYACFLSLVAAFIIRKEVKDIGVSLPFEDVIEALKDLRVEWILVNKKKFLVRDELNDWQKGLFKRVKVQIPPSVLETS